jgi:hypothetical protein
VTGILSHGAPTLPDVLVMRGWPIRCELSSSGPVMNPVAAAAMADEAPTL